MSYKNIEFEFNDKYIMKISRLTVIYTSKRQLVAFAQKYLSNVSPYRS